MRAGTTGMVLEEWVWDLKRTFVSWLLHYIFGSAS